MPSSLSSPSPSPLFLPRPVVINQAGRAAAQAVQAAGLGVQLLDAESDAPWAVAAQGDVLLTGPRNGWLKPPPARPAGWPGRLRWVHVTSAGVDYYPPWLWDVPQVSCSRGVAAVPIAEYVLAALLDHAKNWTSLRVHSPQQWRATFDRATHSPLALLQGQTLGLAGYGAIGQAIAQRAAALGLRTLAWRRTPAASATAPQPPSRAPADAVQWVDSLEALLAQSDHLVLALPLTAQTHQVLNAQTLQHARPGLHLVNIARGALLDQTALLQALDDGRIARATLDVTDPEPLPEGHPLYHHPRVVLTPHLSWSAANAPALTAQKFADNLGRYVRGEALHDLVRGHGSY
ncbi:NAD(P)-dependent oxidoreductase [Acidovorax sp. 62]|uniref:NAD(P)-dependent oxidoreductase n=1 Tax=Acidovorax sp. 62 TaxID=2035203 RepID=UPI001E378825|nr:NAD(P)-dependent oxidoreductase [Acidovorax sp. 62]